MRATSNNRELWLSFIAILAITVAYIFTTIWLREIPPASSFIGHSIGVLGFVMMLMTETLYSLRKRRRTAHWGSMADWLRFHIFTGITGPYMVLLHSSWVFNGLAGVVMLMTIVVVLSGFFGRYIYTSIPRTVDGVEMEVSAIQNEIAEADLQLKFWERSKANDSQGMEGSFNRDQVNPDKQAQANYIKKLTRRRNQLRRQVASIALTRRLFALWHAVHLPIGFTLFIAAFIHIIAAIYYATLLR